MARREDSKETMNAIIVINLVTLQENAKKLVDLEEDDLVMEVEAVVVAGGVIGRGDDTVAVGVVA